MYYVIVNISPGRTRVAKADPDLGVDLGPHDSLFKRSPFSVLSDHGFDSRDEADAIVDGIIDYRNGEGPYPQANRKEILKWLQKK